MRIVDVESMIVSIPLRKVTSMPNKKVSAREYVVTRVRTDEGITGSAYTLGGSIVQSGVLDNLKPILLGEDPFDTEKLWDRMYRHTLPVGHKGVAIRAISSVDIALWDIKGKALDTPLYRLLGGYRDRIPVYASCGYYREGETIEDTAKEVAGLVERGFRAVKLKVGLLSFKEEVRRIEVVRRAVGDDVQIMVDAKCAWNELAYAYKIMRAFEQYDIAWFEEPVMLHNLRGGAELAAAFETPIANGEHECTRWGFRDLIEHRAADILQPDAAMVGGVSEWMKVAALASAYDLPVSSHYFHDFHVHLIAAVSNGIMAEYFPRDLDIFTFDDILLEPLQAVDGFITVPQRPGLGLDLNEEALQRFRVG